MVARLCSTMQHQIDSVMAFQISSMSSIQWNSALDQFNNDEDLQGDQPSLD